MTPMRWLLPIIAAWLVVLYRWPLVGVGLVVVWFLAFLFWLYVIGRGVERAERAARREARFDPTRTAGGAAGKGYTGGFGPYVYPIPGETPAKPKRAGLLP